tara:strand:+ start:238 stop:636 length:399 start_codon:yes stop_codon:yes gene_type:complete
MKRSIKALILLAIISAAFTSCKEETSTPTTLVEIDIRDAAVGIFEATQGTDTIQFEFVKHDSIQDQMEVLDVVEGDGRQGLLVNILGIVETVDGFEYTLDEDNATGTYSKVTDAHTLVIPNEDQDWVFNRVN